MDLRRTLCTWLGVALLGFGAGPINPALVGPASLTADLSITSQDAPDPVIAGANLVYDLTVRNEGPDTATNVTITGALPNGVTYHSYSAPDGVACGAAGQALTCTLGTITQGQTIPVTVTVAVDPGARGKLSFTASVAGSEGDPVTANNTATAQTSLQTDVDLTIAQQIDPYPAVAGAPLTCTLAITNTGQSDATQVVMTDTLPSAVEVTALNPDQGQCGVSGTVVTCTLGTIHPAQTTTIDIVMTVDPAERDPLPNYALISGAEPDSDAADNALFSTIPLVARTDLTTTVQAVPTPLPVAGLPLGYQVHAQNVGPSDAHDVSLQITLPPSVTLSGGPTFTLGECAQDGSLITCTPGTMTAGLSGTVYFTVTISPSFMGDLPVVATITGLETDPILGNNTFTATTPITAHADLSLTLTAPDLLPIGGLIGYQHVISNPGPSDAAQLVLTDAFTPGVTFERGDGATCEATAEGARCEAGTLGVGDTLTVTVYARIEMDMSGPAVATATVASLAVDTDPGDNTVQATGSAVYQVYMPLIWRQ